MSSTCPAAALAALLLLAPGCGGGGAGPGPLWSRPATPAAPQATGLSFLEDPANELTWFFADGELLALYGNAGNTFVELWVGGANLLGGFDPGLDRSNLGPARPGHAGGYPFGRLDSAATGYGRWEGFWAGFNYIDARWLYWTGLNGNPDARRGFEVAQAGDAFDVHVTTEVAKGLTPLFRCDVHYLLGRTGIGVRSQVEVVAELQPLGWDDTGGQLLMTQVDTDLDPALPYDRSQPSQYFQLALDGRLQELDPFPPYNTITPSNIYADQENRRAGRGEGPPAARRGAGHHHRAGELPDRARSPGPRGGPGPAGGPGPLHASAAGVLLRAERRARLPQLPVLGGAGREPRHPGGAGRDHLAALRRPPPLDGDRPHGAGDPAAPLRRPAVGPPGARGRHRPGPLHPGGGDSLYLAPVPAYTGGMARPPVQAPSRLDRLPITFEAGTHTLVLTMTPDWQWTVSIDGQQGTYRYPTQAEAWEAGVREAHRLG